MEKAEKDIVHFPGAERQGGDFYVISEYEIPRVETRGIMIDFLL